MTTINKLVETIVGMNKGYSYFDPTSKLPEQYPGITASSTIGGVGVLPGKKWERIVTVVIDITFKVADRPEWSQKEWFDNMDQDSIRHEHVALAVIGALLNVTSGGFDKFRLVEDGQRIVQTSKLYAETRQQNIATVTAVAQLGYFIKDFKQCNLGMTLDQANFEYCVLDI